MFKLVPLEHCIRSSDAEQHKKELLNTISNANAMERKRMQMQRKANAMES